jgi:hypothetical protein
MKSNAKPAVAAIPKKRPVNYSRRYDGWRIST